MTIGYFRSGTIDSELFERIVCSAAHHRYCVGRAKRAKGEGNHQGYLKWMTLAGLKNGDAIEFCGFRALFVGVILGRPQCVVYEIGGMLHRLGVDDLASSDVPTTPEGGRA